MAAPQDFYTFRQDLRPFGHGTVVSYYPDVSGTTPQVSAALTDLAQGELVGLCAKANGTNNPGLQRWLVDAGTPTNTQVFVGVSRDSQNTLAGLGNQAALTNFWKVNRIGVWTTGVHMLVGKSGDTFAHDAAIYADAAYVAGAQRQVTTTTTSRVQIGKVFLPDGTPIVGDGVKRIPVLIDAKAQTN